MQGCVSPYVTDPLARYQHHVKHHPRSKQMRQTTFAVLDRRDGILQFLHWLGPFLFVDLHGSVLVL